MKPRLTGTIVSWKNDKGFGFIEAQTGGKQIFVHITAFPPGTPIPAIGTVVTYTESCDAQGKICANNVLLLHPQRTLSPAAKAFVAAMLFLLILAGMLAWGRLSHLILGWYISLSAVTFVFYYLDKTAAQKGTRRTPESTLHILSLLGGWPGALCAQQLFRHKSRKQPFRLIFWLTLILNLTGFGYLILKGFV